MNKIVLLVLLALVAWWLIKRMRVDDGSEARPRDVPPEKMVNCAHCGLYLPEKEAVSEDGKFYCCAQHRRPAA